MFTIVISEKGGAERRETFEKNEINVGRVQGNDLMLAKGNVSKHHARLLYRDGRFIVTDLKSTNGTYVNGRKISQATIVREGDKIYIGDFVLRLETGERTAAPPSPVGGFRADDDLPPPAASSPRTGPSAREVSPPGAAARPLPPPVPPPTAAPAVAAAPAASPSVASSPRLAEPDVVSPYPLERDPDDGESAPDLPGAPPRIAPAARGAPALQADARPRGRTMVLGGDRSAAGGRAPVSTPSLSSRTPRSVPPASPMAVRAGVRETPQQAARRLALVTLIDRVADAVDLAPLERSPVVTDAVSQSIERAVREQSRAMRDEGEVPEGIDLDALARDAVRELVGLGALAPLLEDDEVVEIHVVRPDCVLVCRSGEATLADASFTSEVALARVVARLAQQSGDPLRVGEPVVDRKLARGAQMTAVGPPTSAVWVLTVRKRRRIETSLGDLVRAGVMSEPIAAFLEACAKARANVLVVGPDASAAHELLCAVASAAPAGERVAVLQTAADDMDLPQAHVIALALGDHGPRGEQAVYAAARLGVHRLV
ncbi:MAG TPA: FHA domain-containing protein, partial [Polyangiaceae bacterium]|nr:FHA domain-containing protein [Polyangiaceae bacterium]